MPRMSKAELISRQRMIHYLYEDQMGENDISLQLRDKVPQPWHTHEHDLDMEEPKVKVTLRLDAVSRDSSGRWGRGIRRASAGSLGFGSI